MTTTVEIIQKIAASIHKNNSVRLAEQRIGEVQALLDRVLPEYSAVLGLTPDEVLAAIEAKRNVTAPNYYQDANFPRLDDVTVLESLEAFAAAYPSGKYVCPACGGHSTNYSACNTGIERDGKVCNWKAYGLFGTMGKGMRVIVKPTFLEHPRVHEIFIPVEAITPTGEKA